MKNNKIDVILIKPNDKKQIYGSLPGKYAAVDPPWWLAAVGGGIRKLGMNVKLIDADAKNQDPAETAEIVANARPYLVGIMLIGNNLTASTWKMNGASVLAKALKDKKQDLPVFLWGQHVSALPERTLREEACDFVVRGEGIRTIYELVKAVQEKKYIPDLKIKGLWYLWNGLITGSMETDLIEDMDLLPVDGWDLLEEQEYLNHVPFSFEDLGKRNRYGTICTSLGCPFQCTYCAISHFSGRKVRYRSPEQVVKEIDWWVTNRNAYYLRILDENFTLNKEHAMAVCEAVKKAGFHISMWAYARVDTVDEKLLKAMYEAGIRWVSYGFESGSRKVRGLVQKDQYSTNRMKDIVRITHQAGISIVANFMFGLPEDDEETMNETLLLAKELNCEYPNMYCTMAYPGSLLYEESIRNGVTLPESWLGYTQLGYECFPLPTRHLSSKQVLAFRDYAFNAFFKDNDRYFRQILDKFGQEAVDYIKEMLDSKLKRKLLEMECEI